MTGILRRQGRASRRHGGRVPAFAPARRRPRPFPRYLERCPDDLFAAVGRAVAVAIWVMSTPAPVRGQDLRPLAVLVVPPLVVAPLLVALVRWWWLGVVVTQGAPAGSPARPRLLALLAHACVEVALWGAAVGLATVAVVFERYRLPALALLLVAPATGGLLARRALTIARGDAPLAHVVVMAAMTPVAVGLLGLLGLLLTGVR